MMMASASWWITSTKVRREMECESWEATLRQWFPRMVMMRRDWLGWLCRSIIAGSRPLEVLNRLMRTHVRDAGVRLLPFVRRDDLVAGVVGGCALYYYLDAPPRWSPNCIDVVMASRHGVTNAAELQQLRREWQRRMISTVFRAAPTDLDAIELDGGGFEGAAVGVRDVVQIEWYVKRVGRPRVRHGVSFVDLSLPAFRFVEIVVDDPQPSVRPVLESFDLSVRAIALLAAPTDHEPARFDLADDVKAHIAARRVEVRRGNIDIRTRDRIDKYRARGFVFDQADLTAVDFFFNDNNPLASLLPLSYPNCGRRVPGKNAVS